MSAQGGGGLVESRDFVSLRSWQVIKNGNIIEDDILSDDKILSKESPLECGKTVEQKMRSASDTNLTDNQIQSPSIMEQSVYSTLSRSLGAKVFSDDEYQMPGEMFSSKSTTDDNEEFVDASESQGASNSHRPEECDKVYVVSGASIKYDLMPTVAEYTR